MKTYAQYVELMSLQDPEWPEGQDPIVCVKFKFGDDWFSEWHEIVMLDAEDLASGLQVSGIVVRDFLTANPLVALVGSLLAPSQVSLIFGPVSSSAEVLCWVRADLMASGIFATEKEMIEAENMGAADQELLSYAR